MSSAGILSTKPKYLASPERDSARLIIMSFFWIGAAIGLSMLWGWDHEEHFQPVPPLRRAVRHGTAATPRADERAHRVPVRAASRWVVVAPHGDALDGPRSLGPMLPLHSHRRGCAPEALAGSGARHVLPPSPERGGCKVIMISPTLEHVPSVSGRIAVMHSGVLTTL